MNNIVEKNGKIWFELKHVCVYNCTYNTVLRSIDFT